MLYAIDHRCVYIIDIIGDNTSPTINIQQWSNKNVMGQ